MIIEISFGGVGSEGAAQHFMYQFFCGGFSIAAGTQLNFTNNEQLFESFSITTDASLYVFKMSGNYKKNCITNKHSFSVSLSYRLGALY